MKRVNVMLIPNTNTLFLRNLGALKEINWHGVVSIDVDPNH